MAFPDRRTADVLLTILLFAIVLGIIYAARSVIIIFAFSILFAYLIDPIVRFLQRHSLFFKSLRGPHVLEAYLAMVVITALCYHGIFPDFRRDGGQFLKTLPAFTDTVSSGEFARKVGTNLGWADEETDRLRLLLDRHRSYLERMLAGIEQFAAAAFAGILAIPILAIFFLSDGANLANQAIRLVTTEENRPAMQSLAKELHVMLQRYIRAKVILGGLSLFFCSTAMLVLGFPKAITLGVLAGMLEFIPVAGWMLASTIIVTAGLLTHSHWLWMLGLLAVWRVLMDYLIAPRVIGRELEIHPLLAIFTFMVGGAVGGIIGIYLSVPLVAALRVIYRRLVLPPPGGPPHLGFEESFETGRKTNISL
jgi:predicted PurR-regulated permease PerM